MRQIPRLPGVRLLTDIELMEWDFMMQENDLRFPESYITQFTQPDSIIPDPYNPLDWSD
jgi:hypothetical protein